MAGRPRAAEAVPEGWCCLPPPPRHGGLDLVRGKAAERRSKRLNKPLGISMAFMDNERCRQSLPQSTNFSVSVRRLTSEISIQSKCRTWFFIQNLVVSATPHFEGLPWALCRVHCWCEMNRTAEPGLRPRAGSPPTGCTPVCPGAFSGLGFPHARLGQSSPPAVHSA